MSILKAHSEIDGGFVTITGTGTADGGFSIPDVPGGPYYFQYKEFTVLTNEDVLHLTTTSMARTPQRLASNPTMLTINASGLTPWIATDTVSLSITNIAMSFDNLTSLGATAPAVGASSAALTFNYAQGTPHGLIEATAGDKVVLTQNRSVTLPAPHRAAASAATITDLNQSPGLASSVNAVFAPLPQTPITLDWQTTQFEPFAAQVSPSATVAGHVLTVYGVAGQTVTTGVSGKTHQLLTMTLAAGAPNVIGAAQFGNPFGSAVTMNAAYSTVFTVMVQAPGATAAPLYVSLSRTGPLSLLTGPIGPVLGPPRNITVNGVPVTQPLVGVGASPEISWTAPALGVPNRYVIAINQLNNVGGQTQIELVGKVALKGTRVRIPPGLLTAGKTYVFLVASGTLPNTDVEKNPYDLTGAIWNASDAVIGPLTP